MTHVEIQTANGHKLEGSLFSPTVSANSAGVLILHGWGGSRDHHYEIANLLCREGFVCLGVDLRGHGRSAELARTVRPSDNLADAIVALDFLASQHEVQTSRLGAAGFSYGAFLAVLLSQERRLRWLALRAPALYRDIDIAVPKTSIDRKGLAEFRRRKLLPKDSIALRAAADFNGEVLVLESEADSIIPGEQVQNFLSAFEKAHSVTHVMIPGADHCLSSESWKEFAVSTASKWFATGRVQ